MTESAENDSEELSAYIDGELDAAARRGVEERLSRDPEFARQLQRLESAWNLLDGLPRATVNDQFASSTLHMAAVATSQPSEGIAASVTNRSLARQFAWVGGSLAAGILGFGLGRFLWPDPNDDLLRDLPVIEHLDVYRHADSVEFARLLFESGLFAEEGESSG